MPVVDRPRPRRRLLAAASARTDPERCGVEAFLAVLSGRDDCIVRHILCKKQMRHPPASTRPCQGGLVQERGYLAKLPGRAELRRRRSLSRVGGVGWRDGRYRISPARQAWGGKSDPCPALEELWARAPDLPCSLARKWITKDVRAATAIALPDVEDSLGALCPTVSATSTRPCRRINNDLSTSCLEMRRRLGGRALSVSESHPGRGPQVCRPSGGPQRVAAGPSLVGTHP